MRRTSKIRDTIIMKEQKKRKPKLSTVGSLTDLTLGDILVDTNGKQKRVLGRNIDSNGTSYLLSKRDNFENVCGWYTIDEINKKGYTLAEVIKPHYKLPNEISRPYREMEAKRKAKRILVGVVVSLAMMITAILIISFVTSIFRVKTKTRLDHVKDKACLNLVRRLDGKSDAAKHLEFQKCADMYVSDDLESVYE